MSTRHVMPDEKFESAELWFNNAKQGDLENLQIYHFSTEKRVGSLGSHTSSTHSVETKERELIAFVNNPSDVLKDFAQSHEEIPLIRFEFGGNPAAFVGLTASVAYIESSNQIKISYMTP